MICCDCIHALPLGHSRQCNGKSRSSIPQHPCLQIGRVNKGTSLLLVSKSVHIEAIPLARAKHVYVVCGWSCLKGLTSRLIGDGCNFEVRCYTRTEWNPCGTGYLNEYSWDQGYDIYGRGGRLSDDGLLIVRAKYSSCLIKADKKWIQGERKIVIAHRARRSSRLAARRRVLYHNLEAPEIDKCHTWKRNDPRWAPYDG